MLTRLTAQLVAIAALSPAGFHNSVSTFGAKVACAEEVRGVAPEQQARYTVQSFVCSGRSLPADAINDDFCDCIDGSDEPGTSACAGQKDTLFYCRNEHSTAEYVYTSRVNDGICDCCDGGDEWRKADACTNRCVTEGRVLAKERTRRESDLKSGIKQRQALIDAAKAAKGKHQDELEKLQKEVTNLEVLEQEARKAMETAKAAHEEAERIRKAMEEANTSSNSTPIAAQTAASGDASIAAVDSSADPATAPIDEAKPAEADPVVSEYAKWMDGADKTPDEPAALAAEDAAVVSEYTKWMDGAEEALADGGSGGAQGTATTESNAAEEPDDLDDDQGDDFEDRLKDEFDAEYSETEEQPGFLSRQWTNICDAFSGAWRRIFGARKSLTERAKDDAEATHRDAEKKVRNNKARTAELEQKISGSDDDESLAYAGLDDHCVKKKIGEYSYEICFFKNAKQDSVSVGRWKHWESPGVAIFDSGQYCPGGPERSLRVLFQCGPKEQLEEVTEPSRCTYQAKLSHPAACTEILLKALETKGARMPTDEL